jgi:hypothetical protein
MDVADFIQFQDVTQRGFRTALTAIHLVGFLCSILFLGIYRIGNRIASFHNHVTEPKLDVEKHAHARKWVMINYENADYDEEKCVLSGITDISELKRVELELAKRATTDTLTGAMNRRRGIERLRSDRRGFANAQRIA